MSKEEVQRKFDEIVDFAEIEKFIDTPVKRYSSGMYVRLAFAVAAHLEPEILLVDEVLAVGDAEFQKKCLGKMGDVAKEGRTVLFVSHNMGAVTSLCQRGIFIEKGQIGLIGEIREVVSRYLSNSELLGEFLRPSQPENKKLHISYVGLIGNDSPRTTFHNSEELILSIKCTLTIPIKGAQIAFELINEMDQCIFSSTSLDHSGASEIIPAGSYFFECPIDLKILRPGKYRILISSSVPGKEMLDVVEYALVFDLIDDSSPILKLGQNRRGIVFQQLSWRSFQQN